jgi:hypothetical protein
LTSRTLCFPILGCILSPWILSPRWACTNPQDTVDGSYMDAYNSLVVPARGGGKIEEGGGSELSTGTVMR